MRKTLWILLLWISGIPAFAQSDLFRHGKLDNGLTWYIRHSEMEPGKADFYLVQNVGALMEDEHQNGLAHFLEHMAFNGTLNFPKGVQGFLQSHGVSNFNAYTGQDETVYHINRVPVASDGLTDSCLLILKDWSGFLLLDPREIDKERGVILEERRMTRDVGTRIRELTAPCIYNGSKYARHNVIGSEEIIRNFTPEELRAYYHDFYRPDQQAVIVVGDIDVPAMEERVKQLFSSIPRRTDPKPRVIYEIPDNKEPLYCKAIDKETPSSAVTLMRRVKKQPYTSLKEMMRENLMLRFYNKMTEKRLGVFMDEAEPSFSMATVNYGNLVRGYRNYTIGLKPYEGKDRQALDEMLTELQRIKRYGFTEKEFRDRVEEYLRQLDETEKNKERLSNSVYVTLYQNHFLEGKPFTDVEEDIALSREILAELTLKEMEKWAEKWNNFDKNVVILVDGYKDDYDYPTREEVMQIIRTAEAKELKEHREEVELKELMDFDVKGGKVVKEKKIKPFDAEWWTLSNGCRVYYKQVSHDRGYIGLLGESSGGKSLLTPDDLPSAYAMDALSFTSGIYTHSAREMEEMLKGKTVSVKTHLGETAESVSGSCAVEDMEMMFQLLWLVFEKPRFDRKDFDKFISLSRMNLRAERKSPLDAVSDTMRLLRMNPSPRLRSIDESFFDAISYDRMVSIYKERFADASDFVFYIVGDAPSDEVRRLTEKYIGAIPSLYRKEQAVTYDFTRGGSVKKEIAVEMPEEKYMVNIEYRNSLKLRPEEELMLDILGGILRDRYNAEIREEQGGTYGVNVETSSADYPKTRQYLRINFETSLEKGDELRTIAHKLLRVVAQLGVSEEEVADAVLMMKKGWENQKKNRGNSYWMEVLRTFVDTGKDITSPAYFEAVIDKIRAKDIQRFTARLLKDADCFDVVVKSADGSK